MTDANKKSIELTRRAQELAGGSDIVRRAAEVQKSVTALAALDPLFSNPAKRLAMGLPVTATDKLIEQIRADYAKMDRLAIFGTKSVTLQSEIQQALKIQHPFGPFAQQNKALRDAIERIGLGSKRPFGMATETAERLAAISAGLCGTKGSLGAGVFDKIQASLSSGAFSSAERVVLGLDSAGLSALGRSRHWANGLSSLSPKDMEAITGSNALASKEINAIGLAAKRITEMTSSFGSARKLQREIEPAIAGYGSTTAKLAMFAGATDILGPASLASRAAFDSVMGGYNSATLSDVDLRRSPAERARVYRDMDVDEGFVETNIGETLALLIEGGVVEGAVSRAGVVTAFVEAGSIRMRVSARQARVASYSVIDGFEMALRAFITQKLEAIAGPQWFKQRVPGDVARRAKERRLEAQRSGEASLPLINYVDLADLISIIGRTDNWGAAFEAVFSRLEDLRVDILRLNASRRPTMHARPVDPVRLAEAILVVSRLMVAMQVDGAWDEGWDADI